MRKKIILSFILVFSLAFLFAGDYKTDLTKYVAIGDSLSAGYQSSGLVADYQEYSFPNLIAKQLGISDFQQPLISSPGIPPLLQLTSLSPITFTRATTYGAPINLDLPRPYDNLGIPGATLYTCLYPEYDSTTNPFYNIVLRKLGNAVQQALVLKPKLITFWLGNNEVLHGVLTGKVLMGVTVFPPDTYAVLLEQTMALLKTSGAKIVMANIPDVTQIPFVNAIPIYILNPATNEPIIGPDGKPITYIGPEGFLTSGWYVTLSAMDYISQGYGIPVSLGGNGQPLPDEVTLSPAEITALKSLVNQYNAIISEAAKKYNAALVDVNSLFNDLYENGFEIGGVKFTLDYIKGGLFSYDGVHPSSLGYAIIANEFIKKINETFDYDIPLYSYKELFDYGNGGK